MNVEHKLSYKKNLICINNYQYFEFQVNCTKSLKFAIINSCKQVAKYAAQ